MTNINSQTNGASLEDCHTNFFSLTDVCGIKWVVLRSAHQAGGTGEPLEDPVLLSFSKCLEAGLLAVWRRVPRRSLVTYSFDQAGNQVKQPTKGHDDKNQLSQCKELWLFWYGEKPESIKTLVSEELKEDSDCSGSWESGIPYEARTLLFKAVNNLIERSLLSKEFVRLGKWFVQPYDGQDKALHKSSHLSFSFQYFVHGESAVCTSVDVRQHPPVRRLTHAHLASAATLSTSVNVVLAPYGMAGTLTGVSYPDGDPAVKRLLEEWKAFWPLYNNKYTCRDNSGDQVDMPAGVEIVVGGVRLVYPTSYVLVTDIDNHLICETSGQESVEPSPFTGSSHELMSRRGDVSNISDRGFEDSVIPDADFNSSEREGDLNSSNQLASALNNWEFINTTKTFKRKNRRTVKRETREFKGSKYKGGAPVFKKGEFGDPIMWGLDQDGFSSATAHGRINQVHSNHHPQPNNRVPSEGLPLQSPASVGPVTPGPLSVKSETGMPLLSPHTNGPTTPVFTPGDSVPTCNPATPSTPGGPKSQGPPSSVPSPFRSVNPALSDRKLEPVAQMNVQVSPTTSKTSMKGNIHAKRPALPAKEYEEISDSLSLTSAYDYSAMTAWLSHPVKKSRPSEGSKATPMRPMYRRKSQSSLFAPVDLDPKTTVAVKQATDVVKNVSQVLTNGVSDVVSNIKPKTEFDENKPAEEENLFSADGLKPSMTDLDNMFEDSDSEGGLGCVPTPPNSVKPQAHEDEFTKIPKKDPPGNLPNDQLHQMFPTPPSHEHPNLHSPGGDQDMHQDLNLLHSSVAVKAEPASPRPENYFPTHNTNHSEPVPMTVDNDDYYDHTIMLASSKFAPLPTTSLPSNLLPPLPIPDTFRYKPNFKPLNSHAPSQNTISPMSVSSSQLKPGLSPISPATSDANPRSNKSTNPPSVGGPRSVGPTTPRVPHTPLGAGTGNENSPPPPLANSLTINLVLSDSLLNLYRDINFNSCTMCVCTNEGNIKGGESLMYLPEFAGDDDHDCKCGYSAAINRKFSHLAGMFLEDEREVTGLQEDLYFKKKLSLLLLDPKSQEQGEHRFNERASIVDSMPSKLLEVIQQQAGLFASEHSSITTYSNHYLKNVIRQQHAINIVEDMDGTDTIWAALETVRASSTEAGKSDLDISSKSGCLHKWPIIPAPGPFCSEDIVRVMKCLSPILNVSLHVRKGTKSTELMVDGPLTWRQFHRMAGVTTKGNTDDGCEPLPIPSVTVGYEREWMSVSPFSLYYWDSLSLEPWAPPRDIAYIVVAPDNDNLLHEVKTFLKVLSNGYESLKLGRHTPIFTKALRDSILKVGAKRAGKLENEKEHDEWFSAIGDGENSELLRLYSKVCHHYLVPLLSQISLDASLLKRDTSQSNHGSMGPPDSLQEKSSEENGDSSKESSDPLQGDDSVTEPPAIVIYMIDPFSFGVDNPELMRLSSLALMRCFNNMVQDARLPSDSLRQSIYLQTISLESIYSISGEVQRGLFSHPPLNARGNMSRANHLLRGLCMSIYTQSQRPLTFNTSTKTLTGFGPASSAERYLKGKYAMASKELDPTGILACGSGSSKAADIKDQFMRHMYCPPYILAPPSQKNKKTGDADGFGSSTERSTVLFVHYCLSDDQKHLLASLADDRGEMVRTTVININIPNRTRRKKASARRVGLKRLFDWILSVMALSLVPWRLVIGRLGRIGHGELRGWSTLLTRKSLKKAVKQLKDQCVWKSDMPTILSVCLISMEPDSVLRVMHDQYTPDERFGMSANQCNLSTPKDATATHILVFPTSATAQSAVQAAFNDHQTGDNGENDFGFGIDMNDLDVNPNNDENELGLGDLNDIFDADPFSSAGAGNSPSGSPRGNQMSQPGSPSSHIPGSDPAFRYGQEEPGERLEILQQPLALGYLTSTAQTGPMPRWFWASAPHLENVCPVFLKSALHINIANLAHGGEDGLVPQSASGRVHSLDSNYTTDVLRYVLEGYNALSWLVLDPQTHDRKSCLPIHVQSLLQLYHALAALV